MGCHTWFYKRGYKSEKDNPIRRRINGYWYIEETKRPTVLKTQNGEVEYYHDLFRIEGYPNVILFSENQTIDFIKENKIKNVDWSSLKEFWKVYPDGIILFG